MGGAGWAGSSLGRVNRVIRLNGLRVKMDRFKRVKNGFRLRVGSGWVDPYFSHEFLFLFL